MGKLFKNVNMTTKQVINIALLVILIVFIGQNVANVHVRFLFFSFDMPLILIIIVAFLVGFFTSTAFSIRKKTKSKSA